MTAPRAIAIVLLCGAACGGAPSNPAESPERGPDVLIPDVSDDQARAAAEGPAPPTGARQNPVVPEEPVDVEPASPDDIWGGFGSTAGSRGGPDCDQAADCCLKFYQQTAGDPSVQRICSSMRMAPSSLCPQLLSSFQSSAPSIGVQCP